MTPFLTALLLSFGLSISTIESMTVPSSWNDNPPTLQEIDTDIVENDIDGG